MKKFIEFIFGVLVWTLILYLGACWMDLAFSVDPVLPTEMHDWNIIKLFEELNA